MKATIDQQTLEKLMAETKERHKAIADKIGTNPQLRAVFSRPKHGEDDKRFVERPIKATISG